MSNPQATHFEKMHDLYADHYYDAESMRYRRQFIYDIVFQGMDANGQCVAEICCGDGYNSQQLRSYFPQVRAEGFDISEAAVHAYSRLTGFPAHVKDLLMPLEPEFHGRYDSVICIGGVHHCVNDLEGLLKNISLMLKPGGRFVCMEPYASPLLDPIRKLWYRVDPYFEAGSERALLPQELAQHGLMLKRLHFGGGPAFYLVGNSMIFRMPKKVKQAISPSLLSIEPMFEKLLPKLLKGFFVAEYAKPIN